MTKTLMDANKRYVKDLLYKDLAYKLVGCFYTVYNELGPGFKESIYHKALSIELDLQRVPYEEKKRLIVEYKGQNVGIYEPDFLIEEKIIVEIKAVDMMPKFYETQLYYYLKGSDYKLGYIINFGGPKIDIRRRIYEKARALADISVQD